MMKYGIKKEMKLFSWDILYYFQFEVYLFLQTLKKLNEEQEKTFKKLDEEFKKQLPQIPNNNEAIDDKYLWILEYSNEELKRVQRYSIIVSAFSNLEGKLNKICQAIEKDNEYDIKISDLRNSDYLHLHWLYLTKIYKLNKISLEPYFTPIKNKRIIRNKIAHQDGFITDNEVEKINFKGIFTDKIEENKHLIKIDEDNRFILDLLNDIKKFFKQLIAEIDKRHSELKNKTTEK